MHNSLARSYAFISFLMILQSLNTDELFEDAETLSLFPYNSPVKKIGLFSILPQ